MSNRTSRKQPPPPLKSSDLKELAINYVGRYATTRAKLSTYLARKLHERGWNDEKQPDIEAIVSDLVELRYIDDAAFALLHLVNGGLHVVVDATPGYAAERFEGAGVRIEQHFVALAGIGHQPEGARGAQLQVRHLQTPINAADDQRFLAPVELERLAQDRSSRGRRRALHQFCPIPVANGG